MVKWALLTLLFAVAIVGFAGESQARELNDGDKQITAHHGGGGHRGGGRHRGGWKR